MPVKFTVKREKIPVVRERFPVRGAHCFHMAADIRQDTAKWTGDEQKRRNISKNRRIK
jgi:hypothetical protein